MATMSDQIPMLKLKLHRKDGRVEVRRIKLSDRTSSMAKLRETIETVFSHLNGHPNSYEVYYTDVDGDSVTLRTDEELQISQLARESGALAVFHVVPSRASKGVHRGIIYEFSEPKPCPWRARRNCEPKWRECRGGGDPFWAELRAKAAEMCAKNGGADSPCALFKDCMREMAKKVAEEPAVGEGEAEGPFKAMMREMAKKFQENEAKAAAGEEAGHPFSGMCEIAAKFAKAQAEAGGGEEEEHPFKAMMREMARKYDTESQHPFAAACEIAKTLAKEQAQAEAEAAEAEADAVRVAVAESVETGTVGAPAPAAEATGATLASLDQVRLATQASLETAAKEFAATATEEAKEPPAAPEPAAKAKSDASDWEDFISSDTAGVFEALQQLEEMGFVNMAGFERVLKAVKAHVTKDGIDLNSAIADLLQGLKQAK